MRHNRIENLKPFTSAQDRTKARENGRAGGIASGESRRWRRDVREFLQDFMCRGASPTLQEKMAQFGICPEDRTNLTAMFLAMFIRAMNGDIEAANTVLEWAGQLPGQEEREAIERESCRNLTDPNWASNSADDELHDVVIYDPAVKSLAGEAGST